VHDVTGSHPTTQQDKSRQLQRRLYLAAKRSKNRRFHALYDRIYRMDILFRSWEQVRLKGGTAGVDEETIAEIEAQGVEQYLENISKQLKSGKYRPQPVKRVWIPKTDGSLRPLGIPAIRDRIVQQACRIVVDPIFEANFQDSSYGFRPKRSAHQAVKAVKTDLIRNWWVLDADIRSYFDKIDQDILTSLLKRRISDQRVLKLMKQWLRSGVIDSGQWQPTETGVPQGGVISPLLANIYLHTLDTYWKQNYSSLGNLIRYADDFVVICKTKGTAVKARSVIEHFLKRLKLDLHPDKTKIVEMSKEGFDFLGFHFYKLKSIKSGKLLPYCWPSQKAMKSVRRVINQITRRKWAGRDINQVVTEIDRVIVGWRSYFKVGNSTRKFQQLDKYVYQRVRRLAQIRCGSRGRWKEDAFQNWLSRLGPKRFYSPGVCGLKP